MTLLKTAGLLICSNVFMTFCGTHDFLWGRPLHPGRGLFRFQVRLKADTTGMTFGRRRREQSAK